MYFCWVKGKNSLKGQRGRRWEVSCCTVRRVSEAGFGSPVLFLTWTNPLVYPCPCRLPTLCVAPLLQYRAPQHLPRLWAVSLVHRTNSSSAGPGPSLRLHQNTRHDQCLFLKIVFEVPVILNMLPNANGFDRNCQEMEGRQPGWVGSPWEMKLNELHWASLLLASPPCVAGNTRLVFQFVQFGTGLSTGFTYCSYLLPSVRSSFHIRSNEQAMEEMLFFFPQAFFPKKISLLMDLLCKTFLNSKDKQFHLLLILPRAVKKPKLISALDW